MPLIKDVFLPKVDRAYRFSKFHWFWHFYNDPYFSNLNMPILFQEFFSLFLFPHLKATLHQLSSNYYRILSVFLNQSNEHSKTIRVIFPNLIPFSLFYILKPLYYPSVDFQIPSMDEGQLIFILNPFWKLLLFDSNH